MKSKTLLAILASLILLLGLSKLCEAQKKPTLEERVAGLERTVAALQTSLDAANAAMATMQANPVLTLGSYVSLNTGAINGMNGPHIIFRGANVHIRSGSGFTNDGNLSTLSGLGNLVLGYNESPVPLNPLDRLGSHNLIIGPEHRFSNVGGLVAGFRNTVSGPHASASGGYGNTASGIDASVSGGFGNVASALHASVSGGFQNTASNEGDSVSGGYGNRAIGGYSSVSGGIANTASGLESSICGGWMGTASGAYSTISGGYTNTAGGVYSTVSGGTGRSAPGQSNWAAGGLFQGN